jgi:hypothetical protein
MTCIVNYKFITYILSKNKIQKIVYSKQVPEYLSIYSGMRKKHINHSDTVCILARHNHNLIQTLSRMWIRLTTIQCIYFFSKDIQRCAIIYHTRINCHRKDRFGNKINIHPSPLC